MKETGTIITKPIPGNGVRIGTGEENGTRVKGRRQKAKSTSRKEVEVFLVDDDRFFLQTLSEFLNESLPSSVHLRSFTSGEECMRAMSMKPEIVVLDYLLGPADPNGASGLSVLKKINRMSPETFVIMLSSQDDIEAAVNTMKEGAFDYLAKNKTALLRLRNIIKKISESILYSRDMDYEMKRYKTLSIITISLIILLFFVSRLL